MKKEIFQLLSLSPIFAGISAEKIEKMVTRFQYSIKTYKKGNAIVFRGEPCQELMIMIKGTVKGEMIDFKGKAIEIEKISAPRPLAPGFLFGKDNTFPVDVVSSEEVTILSIPKNSLLGIFQSSEKVLNNFLDIISDRTQFLSDKLWFISFKSIKEKIVHYILSQLKKGENTVILPKNHQELSEYFGVTRPSLSRVFSELERENILTYDRKKIIIKNRDKLNQIITES
jgi:CRP-like cAMP-binding protein